MKSIDPILIIMPYQLINPPGFFYVKLYTENKLPASQMHPDVMHYQLINTQALLPAKLCTKKSLRSSLLQTANFPHYEPGTHSPRTSSWEWPSHYRTIIVADGIMGCPSFHVWT